MKRTSMRIAVVACAAALLAGGSSRTGWSAIVSADGAEDSLASARDLYAAANYENALTVLDRMRANPRPDEAPAIDEYRALCLLALGRTDDAQQAIQAVVAANPFFEPPADMSPRVRSAFTDVRRRMLPSVAQDRYARAKAAYDQKDYVAAEAGFKQVLDVLSDPDLAALAAQPPLSDIRTLAAGFRDLSAKAAAPPPLPAAPVLVAAPQVPQPAPPAAVEPQIYGPDDANVSVPIVVRQDLPTFDFDTPVPPAAGVLELVIDEHGLVESAVMRKSIYPRYDSRVLDATRAWKYKPATLDGVPVKYRKVMNISVKR